MAKYLKSKQIGNKGEAFFESLISEYAIAHKIDSSKDVGLDFLCEWVYGERPTQLLFGVQVKTRNNKKIDFVKEKSSLNLLGEYKSNFTIKKDTLDYWKGFDFPVFLFVINIEGKNINCFYKRYTPILCRFWSKPATHSGAKLPPIIEQTCHPFWLKVYHFLGKYQNDQEHSL